MFAERTAEEGILLHVGSAFPSPQDPLGSPQPPSQLCPGERSPAGIQGKRTSQRTHGGLAEQEAGVSDVGRGGLQLGGHIHHIGEEPVEAELHLCPAGEGHHFAQRLWKGKPRGISSLEGPADTFLQTSVPEACGDPQPSPPPQLVALLVPCMLTIATSPVLGSCSQGTDWVCQGPGFLQSMFDLHHLLPSDQGIAADV